MPGAAVPSSHLLLWLPIFPWFYHLINHPILSTCIFGGRVGPNNLVDRLSQKEKYTPYSLYGLYYLLKSLCICLLSVSLHQTESSKVTGPIGLVHYCILSQGRRTSATRDLTILQKTGSGTHPSDHAEMKGTRPFFYLETIFKVWLPWAHCPQLLPFRSIAPSTSP